MSRKSGIIILALIIVSLCIPVIGIYAWQAKQSQLVEPDVESALSFIISSPTFSFDGVTSSKNIKGNTSDDFRASGFQDR